MFSLRVSQKTAALMRRAADHCGCDLSSVIRCAGKKFSCNTLPVIQKQVLKMYDGDLRCFVTARNPGRAEGIPADVLRDAIVSVCLYEIARPRRRRFETSLIEGIDYTVEQEEGEK